MPIVSCTFNEFSLVKIFVERWKAVASSDILVIANSNAGDETSRYLANLDNVYEVQCSPQDYWGASIKKALSFLETVQSSYTDIVITNIDVLPPLNTQISDYFDGMLPMNVVSFTTASKNCHLLKYNFGSLGKSKIHDND